jgi:hypothetical protein
MVRFAPYHGLGERNDFTNKSHEVTFKIFPKKTILMYDIFGSGPWTSKVGRVRNMMNCGCDDSLGFKLRAVGDEETSLDGIWARDPDLKPGRFGREPELQLE